LDVLRAELRDELLGELRRELRSAATPAPEPATRAPAPTRRPAVELLAEQVAAWVAERGPSAPGAIERAIGGNRQSLYAALAHARDTGLLVREGARPHVTYAVPGTARLAPAPPTRSRPQPAPRSEAGGGTGFDKVVAFVRAHPSGCTPQQLATAGVSRTTLYNALTGAIALGLVAKHGEGRGVTYHPAGAPAAVVTRKAAPPTPLSGEALMQAVVSFVRQHPSCRFSEVQGAVDASEGRLNDALKQARADGAIRLEGTRNKSRYFSVEHAATPEPPPSPPTPAPVPPPAAVRQAPPSPVVWEPARESRAPEGTPVDPAVLAKGEAILRELNDAIDGGTHDIRLGVLFQAVVAELRQLQGQLGERSPFGFRLDSALRRITAIRGERNLPFITGLKRGATGDWERIARDARRRLAAFDADAEAVTTERRGERQSKPVGQAPASTPETIEELTRLAALVGPIVLVGGIKKNEVLEQVRRLYGLDVEWAPMQGANSRAADAFVDRIKHGKIGAVVVLEALTGTTQIKSVVAACKESGVPYAYGGAAGKESLRSALRALDLGAGQLLN
jgi:hypothetical protein